TRVSAAHSRFKPSQCPPTGQAAWKWPGDAVSEDTNTLPSVLFELWRFRCVLCPFGAKNPAKFRLKSVQALPVPPTVQAAWKWLWDSVSEDSNTLPSVLFELWRFRFPSRPFCAKNPCKCRPQSVQALPVPPTGQAAWKWPGDAGSEDWNTLPSVLF